MPDAQLQWAYLPHTPTASQITSGCKRGHSPCCQGNHIICKTWHFFNYPVVLWNPNPSSNPKRSSGTHNTFSRCKDALEQNKRFHDIWHFVICWQKSLYSLYCYFIIIRYVHSHPVWGTLSHVTSWPCRPGQLQRSNSSGRAGGSACTSPTEQGANTVTGQGSNCKRVNILTLIWGPSVLWAANQC